MCIVTNTAPHYCGFCCKLRNLLKIHYRQVALKNNISSKELAKKTSFRKASTKKKGYSKHAKYERKNAKSNASLAWHSYPWNTFTKLYRQRSSLKKPNATVSKQSTSATGATVTGELFGEREDSKGVVDWGSGCLGGESGWNWEILSALSDNPESHRPIGGNHENSNLDSTNSQRTFGTQEKPVEIKRTEAEDKAAGFYHHCVKTEPGLDSQKAKLSPSDADKTAIYGGNPLSVVSDIKQLPLEFDTETSFSVVNEPDSSLPNRGKAKKTSCKKSVKEKVTKKKKVKPKSDNNLKREQDSEKCLDIGSPLSVGRPLCACPVCKSESCVFKPHRKIEADEKRQKKSDHYDPNVPDWGTTVKFQCDLCDLKFRCEYSCRRDVAKHSKDGPYNCTTCGQVFQNDLLLCNHKITEHEWDIKERVFCKFCSKGFCASENLVQHESTEHKNKETHQQPTFTCKFCNESFYTRDIMIKHQKSIHRQGRHYLCMHCPFKTWGAGFLMEHLRMHDDTASFCCDLCGLQFRLEKDFKKHKLKHEGKLQPLPRAYECTQCGKSFQTSTVLKHHTRCVHMNDRPYLCSLCGHASKTKYNLKIHTSTVHSTARLFQCLFCDFSANLKGNLQVHMKKVHPTQWLDKQNEATVMLTCAYCNFTTHSEYSLNWHMDKHHKIQ